MNRYKTEIKWAFIFIGMMLTWMILERLFGFHDEHIDKHPVVSNLVMIPAVLTYYFALKEKREKDYQGGMSYKQGFVAGLIMTLIISVFSPLTQYLTSVVITPHYFENAINYTVEQGLQTRSEAESFFNLSSYVKMTIVATPIMGIITTAVIAFFVKSKKA